MGLFSLTLEIIPAIKERRNGFIHYFITVLLNSYRFVSFAKNIAFVKRSKRLQMLDMTQSVGYNRHVDHSEGTKACFL
ncbi:MAG TPA: hypothetical protein DDW33_12370 [Ktedonobacter sp.]|nr:hypothetical protein [Ktedonobacter sp.]